MDEQRVKAPCVTPYHIKIEIKTFISGLLYPQTKNAVYTVYMTNVLRIAVFIPEFKWDRMHLHEIKPETHGVELTAVELDADLSKFDGILHKFTYQLLDGHEADVQRILEYTKTRPDFIVIEPIECIRIFTDRLVLQEFMKAHPLPPCVEYSDGVELKAGTKLPFPFPIVVKAVCACGTPESHVIRIVHSEAQLAEIDVTATRLIAFPFIHHHGVVFKCYALAETTVMRPSSSLVLRDTEGSSFDSQKPIPESIANASFEVDAANKFRPSEEELQQISSALQKSTGVQLIGYDLLRRESDGKLVLVDFNYFPCFRQIENLPQRIADFIKAKAKH